MEALNVVCEGLDRWTRKSARESSVVLPLSSSVCLSSPCSRGPLHHPRTPRLAGVIHDEIRGNQLHTGSQCRSRRCVAILAVIFRTFPDEPIVRRVPEEMDTWTLAPALSSSFSSSSHTPLQDERWLGYVGKRVEVQDYGAGTLAYYGLIGTKKGKKCGIVLDEPNVRPRNPQRHPCCSVSAKLTASHTAVPCRVTATVPSVAKLTLSALMGMAFSPCPMRYASRLADPS